MHCYLIVYVWRYLFALKLLAASAKTSLNSRYTMCSAIGGHTHFDCGNGPLPVCQASKLILSVRLVHGQIDCSMSVYIIILTIVYFDVIIGLYISMICSTEHSFQPASI